MKGVKHFGSREAYRKWVAYGHMRTKMGKAVSAKPGRVSVFKATPGRQKIYIRGKLHKVS
jgi:hypothetical protein